MMKKISWVLRVTMPVIGTLVFSWAFLSSAIRKPLEPLTMVVNANNQFAIDMYKKASEGDKNIFFSPYSITSALGMTYEGARGITAEEIQKVFHNSFPHDAHHRKMAFADLYDSLNPKAAPYKLLTANALWVQKGYHLLPEYVKTIAEYYMGHATNLDFAHQTEQARKTINAWVEEKTYDKIKDLIPAGALNAMTRLVLTNAIYFKGDWQKQFDAKNTKDEDFTLNDGSAVKVKMMSQTAKDARFGYAETDALQILEMPYKGDDLAMLVLLPKDSDLNALEASLSPLQLREWKAALETQRVKVYMPKFKLETKYFMKKMLSDLGMPIAFTGHADFSGIDGSRNLAISDVIHQAFVDVDEKGTEAAAATAVVFALTSMPMPMPEIPIFRADHPFIFMIKKKSTGAILFMGRVTNPVAK